MKQLQHLTCIRCPLGCALEVTLEEGEIIQVSGNSCPLGIEYAKAEILAPKRTVTSVIPVIGGTEAMVSVKTSQDIPKDLIFSCMRSLKGLKVQAPITIGDVIVKGLCGTDIDVIATKSVAKK